MDKDTFVHVTKLFDSYGIALPEIRVNKGDPSRSKSLLQGYEPDPTFKAPTFIHSVDESEFDQFLEDTNFDVYSMQVTFLDNHQSIKTLDSKTAQLLREAKSFSQSRMKVFKIVSLKDDDFLSTLLTDETLPKMPELTQLKISFETLEDISKFLNFYNQKLCPYPKTNIKTIRIQDSQQSIDPFAHHSFTQDNSKSQISVGNTSVHSQGHSMWLPIYLHLVDADQVLTYEIGVSGTLTINFEFLRKSEDKYYFHSISYLDFNEHIGYVRLLEEYSVSQNMLQYLRNSQHLKINGSLFVMCLEIPDFRSVNSYNKAIVNLQQLMMCLNNLVHDYYDLEIFREIKAARDSVNLPVNLSIHMKKLFPDIAYIPRLSRLVVENYSAIGKISELKKLK